MAGSTGHMSVLVLRQRERVEECRGLGWEQGWVSHLGRFPGGKRKKGSQKFAKKKKKVEKDGLRRGMASTRAWWEGEFRVGGSVYVEASLCCPLQGRRGGDACLYQVSHPPAPSLCCFDSSGLAGPSPSFLSPTGWQPDSPSKGAFSLLSWKTLLLAPQGFQFSGAQP